LRVEAGDVLRAPVVGKVREAEALEHRGPLFRPAFLAVERYDAPGDEVLAREQLRRIARLRLGREPCRSTEDPDATQEQPGGEERSQHAWSLAGGGRVRDYDTRAWEKNLTPRPPSRCGKGEKATACLPSPLRGGVGGGVAAPNLTPRPPSLGGK